MPMGPMMHSLNSADDNSTDTSGLFVTYSIVIPSFCIAGIFGNLLSLYILSANTKFKGFMYTYMKGLAITDTLYLIFDLQVLSKIVNFYVKMVLNLFQIHPKMTTNG